MLSKFILIVLILINVKALADEVPLNNIVANYALFYKNIDAGTMRLEIQSNNNYVQIRTKYDGNFLAELANRGYREEISLLKKEMSDLKIEKYSYTDEKDAYNAIYEDINKVKIIDEKNSQNFYLNSDEIIYDPLSLLLHLMTKYPNVKDSYNVISKKALKFIIIYIKINNL